ncbi:protein PLASTID REDOX INSENSITIVE 2, chloroplastic [Spinacia oleracea]|uniref:Protein PLASTID REDOX INSENSITIVE 2, chloroplastic n=1 Tax=Spinacia oleracea TaxID=3562 RepID=A0ABM3RVE0_SPIOL|nr:protein PLASTID REDOX INSENSITIVE 2, chloroplastic-like [Spinacia oleracea]XP_056699594.1 protein PLASTID REDOX INSENSITIVE 2, chloroplastic-like [Spinacia oleracea]
MALYSSLNSSNALVQCSRQNSNIQSSFLVRPFSFPVRSPPNTVSLLISHSSSAPTSEICLPDPIPEFAEAETQKFKIELKTTLLKDEDALGDELDRVVDVCAKVEYFSWQILTDWTRAARTQAPTITNYDVHSSSWEDVRQAPLQSAMGATYLGHEPC